MPRNLRSCLRISVRMPSQVSTFAVARLERPSRLRAGGPRLFMGGSDGIPASGDAPSTGALGATLGSGPADGE